MLSPKRRVMTRRIIMGFHPTRPITGKDTSYEGAINILNQYQNLNGKSFPQNPLVKSQTPAERTRNWLRLFGHDVNRIETMKVIHVAGTKGKGTTCFYCNRILVEHQKITGRPKKIGCLTSPHQIDIRERILINNKKISKSLFSHHVLKLHRRIDSLSRQPGLVVPPAPGFAGVLALLALNIFIEEKVDVAILETGIGGERDSTNIFPRPIATGITTIGLDHVNVLGHSVEEIAWHKSGIFKSGSLAATVPQDDVILKVLQTRAGEKNVAGELQVITDQAILEHGVKVYPDMRYQRYNASLAIFLAEAYLKSEDPKFLMTDGIARSLQDVELLGKSQVLKHAGNTWFISGAHNDISLMETVSWFKQSSDFPRGTIVLIFNQSLSRDAHPLLKNIYEGLCTNNHVVPDVIFCTDQLGRNGEGKLDLLDLRPSQKDVCLLHNQKENSRMWKTLGGSGETSIVHTTNEAIQLVNQKYQGAQVLVTGSSYLSGNALHILQ